MAHLYLTLDADGSGKRPFGVKIASLETSEDHVYLKLALTEPTPDQAEHDHEGDHADHREEHPGIDVPF